MSGINPAGPALERLEETTTETVTGTTPKRRVLRRMSRQPLTVASALVVLGLLVIAGLADQLAPYGVNQQEISNRLQGISSEHLLGTDHLGRDVFSRLVFGTRGAVLVACVPVFVAGVIGTGLGMIAGYRRGWWDRILQRVADVADTLPSVILALVIIAVLGIGQLSLMLAIITIFLTAFLRLARALTLGESQRLYVEAAHISGLRDSNIVFRQILPNIAGPLIAQATIFMGTALLIEASLSFLGLDPGRATWGGMLSTAQQYQSQQSLLPWPPGLTITVAVLAFNLFGDGLRDALAGDRKPSRRALRRVRRAAATASAVPAASTPRTMRTRRRGGGRSEEGAGVETDAALVVRDLRVEAPSSSGPPSRLVDGVSLRVGPNEVLGIVGESGSGKSMTALAALGLLPSPVHVVGGSITIAGQDVLAMGENELRRLRGSRVGMIFQDPLTALSPVHSIETHLVQAIRNHGHHSKKAARARALELLELVKISEPEARLRQFPHQFSGGMAQRVGIAMALAGEPDILIADEATTALDMRVQKNILDLIEELRDRLGTGILLITHDLGLAADFCQNIVVMRRGEVVETGPASQIFSEPQHPYTKALVEASPVSHAVRPDSNANDGTPARVSGEPLTASEHFRSQHDTKS
jgi:peptide/nickel transport system ATP-binding protein/peptide/nickel transport system permease protein